MDSGEVRALSDLVTDLVGARLEERYGLTPLRGADRLDGLLVDIEQISARWGQLPEVLTDVREAYAEHGFERVRAEIRELRDLEARPGDDSLSLELDRLAAKLQLLLTRGAYEYKSPKRVQIDVVLLGRILIEILDLLKKLSREALKGDRRKGILIDGIVATAAGEFGMDIVALETPDSPLLADFAAVDRDVAALAFETIADKRGDCRTVIQQLPNQERIFCKAVDCAEGCHILRHRRDTPADPKKVEDLGVAPTRGLGMDPDYFYWCYCGPYVVPD
ncbi:MAG: hypothetical protein ACRDK3_00825 [Actinomycetota bacterium]